MQESYSDLLCDKKLNDAEISGRYSFQVNEQKNTINNVISIINPKSTDNILDIGSGIGNMSIPISYLCNSVTCIDSEKLNNEVKKRNISNIKFYSGDFIELKIEEKFDKIIVYSVLHCLNQKDLYNFIDKCLGLLNINGIILFGDIPNSDKKKLYINKYQTEEEKITWETLMTRENNNFVINHELENKCVDFNNKRVEFNNDSFFDLIKYIRNKEFNCYNQPQHDNLCFNKTREDIIVRNYS
jgi:2-polyprenyl-3-methyl-5-hydroxy-6-metoxy-1,4-benzoquinol methylase